MRMNFIDHEKVEERWTNFNPVSKVYNRFLIMEILLNSYIILFIEFKFIMFIYNSEKS